MSYIDIYIYILFIIIEFVYIHKKKKIHSIIGQYAGKIKIHDNQCELLFLGRSMQVHPIDLRFDSSKNIVHSTNIYFRSNRKQIHRHRRHIRCSLVIQIDEIFHRNINMHVDR